MSIDLDPAAPAEPGDMNAADYELAKRKANFGESYTREAAPEVAPLAPAGPMPLDITKAQAFLDACVKAHVTYGLGAKVPFYHAVPGRDFTKVDCSGFVREAILEATEKAIRFPDGSVVQHHWVKARGYPHSSVDAAKASDEKVRINSSLKLGLRNSIIQSISSANGAATITASSCASVRGFPKTKVKNLILPLRAWIMRLKAQKRVST